MKTLKLNALALIAFLAIGFTSCNNDDDAPVVTTPPVTSIAAQASANPNLSILVKALSKAGLVQTLSDAGTYTVFAPTNAAFEAAGFTANVIDAQTTPAQIEGLKQILFNHVLATRKASTDLTTGYVKTLAVGGASATNKLDMYIDLVSQANKVIINGGAEVKTKDINASNGIIHVVDKVITLPTIATHAVANPAFNTLESIVTSASQSAVLGVLTGTTAYTVFAPTDAAFTAFNTELTTTANPTGLAGVSAANVTKVLQYHVITGNKLAADLIAGSINTALNQTFTLALSPAVKITDINGRMSNVTPANVQCSNGVIHVLDKVLLPNLATF